jgi:hypothetical protein
VALAHHAADADEKRITTASHDHTAARPRAKLGAMSRVVVTGASGLLGGNLAAELAAAGHEVVATRRAGTKVAHLADVPIVWADADLGRITDAGLVGHGRLPAHCCWALAAHSPGAAEMLKRMKLPLDQLPVYRRIWLGQHAVDRLPDLVITPEHALEVNGNSSLLAAIATGARGRRQEIQFEGRSEEAERMGLLEKARRAQQAPPEPARTEPGPLGPLMRPIPAGTTHQEDKRIASLIARRHQRAGDAQQGAGKLVAWLHQFTTEKISG